MADKQDNFWGGFIFGSLIGGIVGAVVATQLNKSERLEASEPEEIDTVKLPKPENVDQARRSLEQKIAQLNAAIDAVSHELSTATGNGQKLTASKSSFPPEADEERAQNLFKK